jgi:hypothetical protein
MRRVSGLWLSLALVLPRLAFAMDPLVPPLPSPNAVNLTDVASSFDEGNKFDFRFQARYDHFEKRAQIKRELEMTGQDTVQTFKDLVYQAHTDAVTLRAEFGLYHDLMLALELPIIIEEQAAYGFDQSAGGSCVFPPASSPNCVNATNSRTVLDGIAPAEGYDATNRGVAINDGTTVFRGPLRGARGGSGGDAFDTLNVGFTWAPMSQARDDTKPTWVINAAGEFSIGNIKEFNRADPNKNHGVSDGTHRFFVRTALSKRFRKWIEPYFNLWYLLPIARSGSLFVDYGPSQKVKNPQMQGGTSFGAALVPYDRPDKQYQVAIDLRGRIQGHFQGRGYSEAWELLAGSPVLACDTSQAPFNPACDPAQNNPYTQNPSFTGVTTIESYASLGAEVAVQAQVGPYFRFRTGFNYQHDQSHLITGDDIGVPNNPSGRVTTATEFNPAYRPIIDLPGRRYLVDNVNVYNFNISAQVMF